MTIPKQLEPLIHALLRLRASAHADAARDWAILLSVCAIGLLASIGWNISYFYSVVQEEVRTPAAAAVEAAADPVGTAKEHFLVRAAEATRYEREYRFVDPSR